MDLFQQKNWTEEKHPFSVFFSALLCIDGIIYYNIYDNLTFIFNAYTNCVIFENIIDKYASLKRTQVPYNQQLFFVILM